MALTTRIVSVFVNDNNVSSPTIPTEVIYEVATDAAEAVAVGTDKRIIRLRCEMPREASPALQAALAAALLVIDDGGWPEAAIGLPLVRKSI